MTGVSTVCSPVDLAAVAPHDADYAYIKSYGNPVHVAAMTACCAPQEARQDGGCYTWCRLPAGTDIDAPESQMSWERDFQYCLNYQGRLLALSDDGEEDGDGDGGGGRYRAPWVHAVKSTEGNALVSAASHTRHDGEVGGVVWRAALVVMGVLSWALA
ncbi:hypothetical protein PG993_009859 [Apiospora rasikravindrae]|uniref:Uncharacterized protein n=1 Tax=Apiospora rasikravindrae TaxID=990691 RepID=A0ABR1SMD0_9PEZI